MFPAMPHKPFTVRKISIGRISWTYRRFWKCGDCGPVNVGEKILTGGIANEQKVFQGMMAFAAMDSAKFSIQAVL